MQFRNEEFGNKIRMLQLETCRSCIQTLIRMRDQHADTKDIIDTLTNVIVGSIGTLIQPDYFQEVIDHVHTNSINKLVQLQNDMENGKISSHPAAPETLQ